MKSPAVEQDKMSLLLPASTIGTPPLVQRLVSLDALRGFDMLWITDGAISATGGSRTAPTASTAILRKPC